MQVINGGMHNLDLKKISNDLKTMLGGPESSDGPSRQPLIRLLHCGTGHSSLLVPGDRKGLNSADRTALPMLREREGRRCSIVKKATPDAALGSR
jgi:hypothetical protein